MKRAKNEPKVIGAAEAASILGVTQTNLRAVKGLPEPYDHIRATTLWREDEIRQLARRRKRAAQARDRRAAKNDREDHDEASTAAA